MDGVGSNNLGNPAIQKTKQVQLSVQLEFTKVQFKLLKTCNSDLLFQINTWGRFSPSDTTLWQFHLNEANFKRELGTKVQEQQVEMML